MGDDVLVAAMTATAKDWRQEAEERRRISTSDPVADTLDYCAGELAARLRDVQQATELLTVAQYARAEGVTAQTVRAWIRRDLLPAQWTAHGYRIPKGARRAALPIHSPRVLAQEVA